jgi:hypothetical protein
VSHGARGAESARTGDATVMADGILLQAENVTTLGQQANG